MGKKNDFHWVYGSWAKRGWGAMLIEFRTYTQVAFKSEETPKKVKVIKKQLYNAYKKLYNSKRV